jgi:hypothetical protein
MSAIINSPLIPLACPADTSTKPIRQTPEHPARLINSSIPRYDAELYGGDFRDLKAGADLTGAGLATHQVALSRIELRNSPLNKAAGRML